ncbi:MAG: hypothetical protein VB030_04480 [Eubacterium aggregans]|uniref:hypothetical protein n=1 Tax=Eubacterium aggregans TaxID=81409 RepID=UPI002B201BF1|nr:hypothetical protein [Eubacterium aggregans]MEA5073413.1 hypothetical protein [Eubacterium aggregans]
MNQQNMDDVKKELTEVVEILDKLPHEDLVFLLNTASVLDKKNEFLALKEANKEAKNGQSVA